MKVRTRLIPYQSEWVVQTTLPDGLISECTEASRSAATSRANLIKAVARLTDSTDTLELASNASYSIAETKRLVSALRNLQGLEDLED